MEAWIEFTQPPDPAGSGLELLDANLTPVGGGVFALEGDRMTLQLPPALPSGGYVLRWVALSASDGHTTKGNIPFAIGQASAPEVATLDAEQAPSLLAILGKSLLYLGLTLTIGMLAFHMWVTPSSHHAWWRASLFAGGVAAFVGTLAFGVAITMRSPQPPFEYLTLTSFGRGLLARTGFAMILLATAFAASRKNAGPLRVHAVFAAALALLVLGAVYSHTASAIQPAFWGVTVDALHLVAAFAWTGGLVALALHLRADPEPSALARTASNFSALATLAIAIVTIVGFFMLFALTGTSPTQWLAGLKKPYVRYLDAKIALFFLMAALGAANRWLFVAHFARGGKLDARHAFRRSVQREVAVGVAILVLAGVATNYSPPDVTLRAESTAPLGDQAFESVFVREEHGSVFAFNLTIDPAPSTTRASNITVRIVDHRTGDEAVDATNASLALFHRTKDLGRNEFQLTNHHDGTFTVSGRFFPVSGPWRVTIAVNTPAVLADSVNVNIDVK